MFFQILSTDARKLQSTFKQFQNFESFQIIYSVSGFKIFLNTLRYFKILSSYETLSYDNCISRLNYGIWKLLNKCLYLYVIKYVLRVCIVFKKLFYYYYRYYLFVLRRTQKEKYVD